jgi:hypothetical protein
LRLPLPGVGDLIELGTGVFPAAAQIIGTWLRFPWRRSIMRGKEWIYTTSGNPSGSGVDMTLDLWR